VIASQYQSEIVAARLRPFFGSAEFVFPNLTVGVVNANPQITQGTDAP
jgi:hypothetical protein